MNPGENFVCGGCIALIAIPIILVLFAINVLFDTEMVGPNEDMSDFGTDTIQTVSDESVYNSAISVEPATISERAYETIETQTSTSITDEEYNDAYEEGYDDAYDDGYRQGQDDGIRCRSRGEYDYPYDPIYYKNHYRPYKNR